MKFYIEKGVLKNINSHVNNECNIIDIDLNSITIPDSVTQLDDYCFADCFDLSSIIIPTSVSKLGNYCFHHCNNLNSITIPTSISSLSSSCFRDCNDLNSITIPDSVTQLDDYCFTDCDNLTSIIIPTSVSILGNFCFEDCSNLTSIIIPTSVSKLGYNCFSGCSNLSSVIIPNSVTELGDSCFENCINLSSITLGNSVTYLSAYCFSGCSNLSSITIPDSVLSLGDCCFSGCSNLNSIIFPENMIYNLLIGCFIDYDIEKGDYIPRIKRAPIIIKQNTKYLEFRINENNESYSQTNVSTIINIDESSKLYQNFNNNELTNFDDYIKEQIETYQNFKCESLMEYNKNMIDIINEFINNINSKQNEIQLYIKLLQYYSSKLSKLITELNQINNKHLSKIDEMKRNNYKLPKLNTIPKLGCLIKTVQDEDTFEDKIVLDYNYYHKDNLIIPETDNPYTEIYKLPCNFCEITPENKRILTKAEKKIALLTIEYEHEYIDLSNTDIQYFIDTFKNCTNLNEIKYPESVEYK